MITDRCADICVEVLGKSAAKKIAQVLLFARAVASQIKAMPVDIETQLLEQQMVRSPWFAIQCDESTDIESKAVLLVFVRYLYEKDVLGCLSRYARKCMSRTNTFCCRTKVRWLNRGKSFNRFFELSELLRRFLSEKNLTLDCKFVDQNWNLKLKLV